MARHSSALPKTAADKALSKKHLKATMKLEKKKAKDHIKMAKSGKGSKSYNLSHAKMHKKNIKADQKYLKKVSKLKVKSRKK